MGSNFSPPPAAAANNLFAAVDMGTNSFKLTVVRIDSSSGRFFTIHRLKQPVLLGLETTTISVPTTLSSSSLNRSISALLKFQSYLHSHRLPPSHTRLVATSAVREASNSSEFLRTVNETLDCYQVEILSGQEEARLVYLGILQFFPLFSSMVLAIDIGGGSTEFTVGFEGKVLFAESLRLGHITLSQEFNDVVEMREHIRNVLENSGLIEKINEFKIDVVVGSSGTIKAIEKAVCKGYTHDVDEIHGVFEEFVGKEWKFSRNELQCLVEKLCDEEERGLEGKVRRIEFFKNRAEFILAGAILLDEIFERLGIEEIEVSGYALGEGVITEMLRQDFKELDLNLNARWRSVVRLASRLNNKKRMKSATECAGIARDIFEGLRKWNEVRADDDTEFLISLDDKDLEYLEAASLLHNIGLYTGRKGYHKQSCGIIMKGNHLNGYTEEEIELIGLLVRHHRKKVPKNVALEGHTKEKFRFLCAILRVSVMLQQCLMENFQIIDFINSPEGFKLVLNEGEKKHPYIGLLQPFIPEDAGGLMEKEMENFRKIFRKKLCILVTSNNS